uniref:Small lysine-rich protein 1 n=1 Tax=Timema shepardi TaxID=629360 RepID=A0A7R9FVM3_TIMSH|nr:unnamed protein product [Timema shepardi]
MRSLRCNYLCERCITSNWGGSGGIHPRFQRLKQLKPTASCTSGDDIMAGKGKRKPSRRPSDGEKKQGGGGDDEDGDEGATKTSKKSESRSKSRCNIDIFNEHAMDNAYYTCHNIQDVLKCRGFPWPEAQKKKKKGKKR